MTAPRLCLAVLLAASSPLRAAALDVDPGIAKLLAEVSPARLEATLKKLEYLARNARVNAAALATLAPAAPVVFDERGRPLLTREPSGYDARLRWRPSPRATSYRIFWREAWTPDWQFEQSTGNVTEAILPGVSIDDFVVGVAAVDANGHESLVSAYVNPNRPDRPIQTLP